MIGVTSYVGPCRVCMHAERERITAALLAHVGARVLSEEVPELSYRDIKQHERDCLPHANNQRNQRGTA